MTRTSIRLGLSVAKLVLIIALFLFICDRAINTKDISVHVESSSYLVLAIVVNQLALWVFSLRMRSVLEAFDIQISRLQAHKIHLQSVFYYFVLPMNIGLEMSRYVKVKALVGDGLKPLMLGAALLADRMAGVTAAIAVLICTLALVSPRQLAKFDLNWLLLIGGVALIVALTIYISKDKLKNLSMSFALLIRLSNKQIAKIFFFSILTHILFAAAVFFCLQALSVTVTFVQTIVVICSSMLLLILPISFAGFGPAEGAAFTLFVAFGFTNLDAALAVSCIYFAKLMGGIEGGIWEFYNAGFQFVEHLADVDRVSRASAPPNTGEL